MTTHLNLESKPTPTAILPGAPIESAARPKRRRTRLRTPVTGAAAIAALVAALSGASPAAAAAQPGKPAGPASPAATSSAVTKAESTSADAPADSALYWYDGGRRQALRVDGEQLADFRRSAKDSLRPAGDVEKSPSGSLPDGVSPVLRNAGAAAGDARALPGGVIVTLQAAPAGGDAAARESTARELLQGRGLTPVRALDAMQRIWLLESPPGLPSLELANRLHESGGFESAEPNWWRPRARK
ncbi:MAG: hypothetical protein GX644_14195 [Limnobacter sp.]|nr:hypothetical protein [Limnobacter sp.]